MRAALVEALPARELAVVDVELGEPGPADLVVDVEACGICGTDLHILAGESYRPELPFVLGHEPVGTVRAAGSEVSAEWVGRRITIGIFRGCGVCALCVGGDERLCENLVAIQGVQARWGGFAEQMIVTADQAVEVPEGLTAFEAAALVDAGATAANAAGVLAESGCTSCLVLGGGPVGVLVAELAGAVGSTVTVVEPTEVRRLAVSALGHAAVGSVRELEGRFEAVVDCSAAPDAVQAGLSLLAARGLFLVVGYTAVPQLDLAPIARRELRVLGIRSGSRAHLHDVLAAAAGKRISLPPMSVWELGEINEALRALRQGEVAGKAVISINR